MLENISTFKPLWLSKESQSQESKNDYWQTEGIKEYEGNHGELQFSE